MLFNSVEFLVFFPIVTILYYLSPQRARVALLLSASCLFYMFFIPIYIFILLFTIAIDYCAGIVIEGSSGSRRRWMLGVSLVANVGVLAVFKYYNFFIDSANGVIGALGYVGGLPALGVILPIGLSFHTFQAMSYTIEVYRGHQAAERDFLVYSLYVMFYPQLVAGPIERPQNLLPQFHCHHSFHYDNLVQGLVRMAVGMFKKVVIADNIAAQVNVVFDDPTRFQGLPLIIATVLFSFQIYYDFSGYSDIAVGSARAMGFHLMENFDAPYFATSIGDFWRRWHISLSTWFKDYLYFPLGGSRLGALLHYRNLLIVFLVSGLWHGASWSFVLWGLLHGLFLVAGDATRPLRDRFLRPIADLAGRRASTLVATLWTFTLVTIAWIFFRAQSLSAALYFLSHLFKGLGGDVERILGRRSCGLSPFHGLSKEAIVFCFGMIFAAMLLEYVSVVRRREREATWIRRLPMPLRYACYYVLIYGPILLGPTTEDQQFIYFQF